MTHRAKELFHGKEGYNCAQAVLKAFQDRFNTTEQQIESAQQQGGGRAPGGVCGALFAAQSLVEEPQEQVLTQTFKSKVGHTLCDAIKASGVSCYDCVETAENALEQTING